MKYLICFIVASLAAFFAYSLFSASGKFDYAQVRTKSEIDSFKDKYPEISKSLVDSVLTCGLDSNYVPQGVAFYDGSEIVVAYYFKGLFDSRPSIFLIAETSESQTFYVYDLYDTDGNAYTGHVGGIAVSGQYLWTCAAGRVLRFERPDRLGETLSLTADLAYDVDSNADFVTINDGRLWVGEFAFGDDYVTPAHHHYGGSRAWIAGYDMDIENETLVSSTEYIVGGRKVLRPDAVMFVGQKVQGAAICDDKVVLSSSYGFKDSELDIYSIAAVKRFTVDLPGGNQVETIVLGQENRLASYKMPAGAEGMSYADNKLAITFEGGSKHYRRRWRLRGGHIEDRVLFLDLSELIE